MRVRVDPDKCEGHNRCSALAPALFEIDDYGTATASESGPLSEEQAAKAVLAAENCPDFAIEILADDEKGAAR